MLAKFKRKRRGGQSKTIFRIIEEFLQISSVVKEQLIDMDEQKLFRTLNFCVKVLESFGLTVKSNFYIKFLHIICFNGFFLGMILNLNLKSDEYLKNIEQINLIFGLIRLELMLIKIITGIKIEEMKEKVTKLLELLKSDEIIKCELNYMEKLFKLFFTLAILPLTASTIVLPIFFNKLPFKLCYPMDLEDYTWFKTAAVHQIYINFLVCIIFISFYFLSIVFISFSVGFLQEIQKQLYYTVGLNREKVFINCMKAYKLVYSLIQDVKTQFESNLLCDIPLNTLQTAILLFSAFKSEEFTSFLVSICVFLPILTQMFVSCNFGQDLINSSKNAFEAFSYPKWQDIDDPIEISRRKFLKKYKKTIKITLNNMINLDLKSFYIYITVFAISLILCIILKFA